MRVSLKHITIINHLEYDIMRKYKKWWTGEFSFLQATAISYNQKLLSKKWLYELSQINIFDKVSSLTQLSSNL